METLLERINRLPVRDFPILPRKENYPLQSLVISCGHGKETTQDYNWDGIKRGDKGVVIFQYTVAGWGMLRYENSHYRIDEGKAMLLRVPHNHCYWLPEESRFWQFIYTCLSGPEIFRIFHYIEKKCVPVINIRHDSPVFETYFRIHRQASDPDTNSSYKLSYLAYEMGMNILLEIKPKFKGITEPDFIAKAKDFCRKNYDKPINVDDMAKAAGYSRFHFSRLFKQVEDITPHEYIEHLRINKACELLLSESIPIKEISSLCGFTDVNYFCKVFKQITKTTPATYRNRGF